MLLRRREVPGLDAIERLVGLQAQVPRDPYIALWSRLHGFRPETLASAIADRQAVRMTLRRGTLHLVTARDALALRPLIQPVIERTVYGSSPLRNAVKSVDVDELLAFFRALLEERPRTRAERTEVGWGAVLVDGMVGGRWKLERPKDAAMLLIEPFVRLGQTERDDVTEEGRRLLAFAAADAQSQDVRVVGDPVSLPARGS